MKYGQIFICPRYKKYPMVYLFYAIRGNPDIYPEPTKVYLYIRPFYDIYAKYCNFKIDKIKFFINSHTDQGDDYSQKCINIE